MTESGVELRMAAKNTYEQLQSVLKSVCMAISFHFEESWRW